MTQHDNRLADRLASLARELQQEDDVEATLQAIADAATGAVPGATHASISAIRKRREVQTLAASGEIPRQVDQAQYDTQQGPCLDTLYDQETVRLPDLAAESRWPDFTKRASALGIGSMLAVQLFVEGDDLGALNLFSEGADAFDDESEHIALLFASHAAVALAGAQQQERLHRALGTRDLVGQAKGILMERFKLTGDEAFRVLVHASQQANRKLNDIAEELVTSGAMPRG
jgi:GAF domain-containing protein